MTLKAGRKRRSRSPRGVGSPRELKPIGVAAPQMEEKEAEIARLARDLAEAQARLRDIEEKGADVYSARKIATTRDFR